MDPFYRPWTKSKAKFCIPRHFFMVTYLEIPKQRLLNHLCSYVNLALTLHWVDPTPCHKGNPWITICLVNINHHAIGCHCPLFNYFKFFTLWRKRIFHGYGPRSRPLINLFNKNVDVWACESSILIPLLSKGSINVSHLNLCPCIAICLPNQIKLRTKALAFFKANNDKVYT